MTRHVTSRLTRRVLVPTMAASLGLVSLTGAVGAQSPQPAASAAIPTLSAACADPANLPTKTPGRLTLSTDNPAFPPWWGGDPTVQYPGEPAGGDGWTVSDPYSGEGYEGATAYAVAETLGFTQDTIDWVPNAVFENAFQPGPKAFDWHMAQISIRPERAQNVDFSDPYFDANQSIIAMTKDPITAVTTIAGLKDFKLGAAVGTTSLQLIESVIQPTQEPSVFNDNASTLAALQNGQIDGLVADLQTAIYMRDAQLEDYATPDPEATVVGQFSAEVQVDQVGMVLEKDSPLTACVDEALAIVKANGTLDQIYHTWISPPGKEIPFFQ